MKKAKGPLQVLLGDVLVGLLAREAGGRIRFMFDEQYAEMSNRPSLSLSYEAAPGELLTLAPRAYSGRLPPFFSNLLPEGLLRDLLVRRTGVRPSDEFALIGNGDAHLKNWSVLYDDPVRPTLSPAYDLVSSLPYIPQNGLALGFGGSKRLRPFDDVRIKQFAGAAQLPFELVRRECLETAERTRDAWARHEQRDVLPQHIDKVVSTQIESISLDMSGSMSSRARLS